MTTTQLTFEQLQLQTFKDNIDIIVEWMIPVMERKGYTVTKPKRYLTTREMCEMAGISYSSWTKSEVRNLPQIAQLRDRYSGQAIQYKESDVDTIKSIWREYHRKKSSGGER